MLTDHHTQVTINTKPRVSGQLGGKACPSPWVQGPEPQRKQEELEQPCSGHVRAEFSAGPSLYPTGDFVLRDIGAVLIAHRLEDGNPCDKTTPSMWQDTQRYSPAPILLSNSKMRQPAP